MRWLVLLLASSHAWAEAEDCFKSYLFRNARTENAALARIFNSPALHRWKKSPDPLWEKIANSVGKSQKSIRIDTPSGYFQGGTRIEGNTLQVEVGVFSAKKKVEKVGGKKIQYGERPESLDPKFTYMIGSLFEGIDRVLESNPLIEHVEIKGTQVVNKNLAAFLGKMGFEPKPTTAIRDFRKKMTRISAIEFCALATIAHVGHFDSQGKCVPLAINAIGKGIAPKIAIEGDDWFLKLHVPRREIKSLPE